MITVEKLEKGTYFDDAFKISFRYDPTTVAKVKELAEQRYLPEDRAWEIPAHELPALIEKVGLSNIKSEEAVVQALNTKEIEDNSLKTEVVMTANLREWRHFLSLRACGSTGKPHPQMLEVAVPLLKELRERVPVVFDDLEPMELETVK